MAASQLPASFLSDWAVGGARAREAQRAVVPAEAHAAADEGSPGTPSASLVCLRLNMEPAVTACAASIAPYDEAVKRVAACAVSLAFLTDFYARCVAPLEGGGALLTTTDVRRRLILPETEALSGRRTFASLVPGAVGPPDAFASHAFGNPFRLLVSTLKEHFMNAVPADVYIWVDIFAVDQHNVTSDLHDGKVLKCTVELAAMTLVVLDRARFTLTRLWCLFEIGCTPTNKLRLLTRGFNEAELAAAFLTVNVADASCTEGEDSNYYEGFIRGKIEEWFTSQDAFQRMLRLRLLLKPTSYEADRKALLTHSTDTWRFDELCEFATSASDKSQLACIAGGPGEGKSTLAAKLCAASPPLVHAHHFCKASDVRRQDEGEVIRSLAYQLALRFPPFGDSLLKLGQADVESLSDPVRAWELLLKEPLWQLSKGSERVVLLFDALDEAGGSDSRISKVLSLLLKMRSLFDIPNSGMLHVIVTTRPEAGILTTLRSRWGDNMRDFKLASLRDGDEQMKLLALLQKELPGTSYADVDAAYAALFSEATPEPAVVLLLSILLAAQQPPSMALLKALGVHSTCAALPSWGLLFQEREHCVHLLHKTLSEWLLDTGRSGLYAVDVTTGRAKWADQLTAQVRPWLDSGRPSLAPPTGSYAYAHLLPHLDAAGRCAEARATLMQLPWLQATLRERGLYALMSDVAARMTAGDGTLSLLHRTLRLAAPGLQGSDAAEALPAQLVGRLGALLDTATPEVVQLYEAAHRWRGTLRWLRPVKATLQAPVGALELSLEGHTGPVTALMVLAGGLVASYCVHATTLGHRERGMTVRVWDVATGECERSFMGQINTLLRWIVSDEDICVEYEFGYQFQAYVSHIFLNARKTHSKEVTTLVGLPDGRVVSGSQDCTMRVWNSATGMCERTLEGHTSTVTLLVALLDGRVVSGSSGGNALRVWNVDTGECERTLAGHIKEVTALEVMPDGRVVSGSRDNTLRVWNAAVGEC